MEICRGIHFALFPTTQTHSLLSFSLLLSKSPAPRRMSVSVQSPRKTTDRVICALLGRLLRYKPRSAYCVIPSFCTHTSANLKRLDSKQNQTQSMCCAPLLLPKPWPDTLMVFLFDPSKKPSPGYLCPLVGSQNHCHRVECDFLDHWRPSGQRINILWDSAQLLPV
jgi:hypothetical protein